LPYKRAVCENYVELSPPRRNRRRIELDEQENNCEHAMPGHLCNEVNSIVKILDSERSGYCIGLTMMYGFL